MSDYGFETTLLHEGSRVTKLATDPETVPVYLTTAFHVDDLDALEARYAVKGFCYNRSRNPNRTALIDLMNSLEQGEDSIVCNCGMAAISTVVLSLLKQGDHILADKTLYGETVELFDHLENYGIKTTFANFTDTDEIKKHIQPETKILYTETISNPMISVVDIKAVAEIAHDSGSWLVVDNTFTSAVALRPLSLGADIVINSLTKFANGHSDVLCGSATGKAELIQKAQKFLVLHGGVADPMSAWLCQRGMRTMGLRIRQQMQNAEVLAAALEKDSRIKKVLHPSLASHPQHELVKKMYQNGCVTAMMSIEVEPDREKINAFMRKLNVVNYAMTLGGLRTTIAHPCTSSHYGLPQEFLDDIGITYGLIRVSVGLENVEDLIADFKQALDVFES